MRNQSETWLPALRGRNRITYIGTAAVMLALALRGPEFARDSISYIEASSLRTLLYPLFLRLTNPTGGEALYSVSVVVQLLLGGVAVATTAIALGRMLSLGRVAFLFTWGGLMVPYLGPQQIGNSILSEGLAYPLFLLGSRYLLKALVDESDRSFLLQLVFYSLALLTRNQIVFVFPVAMLAALYLGWQSRNTRRVLILSTACLASFFSATLIDRTYHLMRHGSFSGPSISGLVFATPALYLSTEGDLEQLHGPAAALLRRVRKECHDKGLLSDSNDFPGGVTTYSGHYASVYNEIAWRALYPALAQDFGAQDGLSDSDWYQASGTLSTAAATILMNHPTDFARLYVSIILRRLDMSYAVLLACALVLGIRACIRTPSPMSLTLTVTILLHLANLGATAVVQPIRLRYAFYTETLLVVVLVLVLAAALLGSRTADGARDQNS